MIKKSILLFIVSISILRLQADELSDSIVELQKNETILVDKIYDHRDYAVELWNNIVISKDYNKIDKGIVALDYAIELSSMLFSIEDQLISYYSKLEKNSHNLGVVKKNKQIARALVNEITSLKDDFIDKKTRVTEIKKTDKDLPHSTVPDMSSWTSIPAISDSRFRKEIYDYYPGGNNKFIHKMPLVLVFYDPNQDPSINQLLNIEDIYDKYNSSFNFYRISPLYNKELIKVFKVTELPTIYYLNMDSILQKHVGNRGYSDIEDMLISHFSNF